MSITEPLTLTSEERRYLELCIPFANEQELQLIQQCLMGTARTAATGTLEPTERQREFLSLTCEEALYGGAVGGAKTFGLLLYLAEGVGIPGYTGYFFRRTWAEIQDGGNESPLAKALRVYAPMGGVFNGQTKAFRFPSGAAIAFGHLEDSMAHLRYQGPSGHRFAWDELTHFTEDQYLYMIGYRMRRDVGFPIRLGTRASCNPGGPGHGWVKNRFITPEAQKVLAELDPRAPCPPGLVFWATTDRAFVPARLADNPYLDIDDYEKRMNMQAKNPVLRARMMNGDWSVTDDGLINPAWLRYYATQGEMITLFDGAGQRICMFDSRECSLFSTGDTAGTSKDKLREHRGKPPSWSVVATWLRPPRKYGHYLVLMDVWRDRCGFTELLAGIEAVHAKWKCRLHIENAHFGPAVYDSLRYRLPIDLISTEGKGKVERGSLLLNRLKDGEIFLPKYNSSWKAELESEWLSFGGLDDDTSDQFDVAAYAAIVDAGVGATWGGVVTAR